jgi:hypothetical protein
MEKMWKNYGKMWKKRPKRLENMKKTMENLGINGVNSANDVENPWGSLFGN